MRRAIFSALNFFLTLAGCTAIGLLAYHVTGDAIMGMLAYVAAGFIVIVAQ